MEVQSSDNLKALFNLTTKAASIPTLKLKNVNRIQQGVEKSMNGILDRIDSPAMSYAFENSIFVEFNLFTLQVKSTAHGGIYSSIFIVMQVNIVAPDLVAHNGRHAFEAESGMNGS
ncbi:hypothetical protein AKJ16_DCAP00564 [Drosera capensis]